VVLKYNTELKKLISWTRKTLGKALLFRTYAELMQQTKPGMYIVFDGVRAIYVGKTTRSGKVRVSEMASDYRSHTLNKKLLTSLLIGAKVINKGPLKRESKVELISRGKISKKGFRTAQARVNSRIRNSFRFIFIPCKSHLSRLEHWTIALLNPRFND
jgi:hypothetical protein